MNFLSEKIYNFLSDEWCGNKTVPLDNKILYFKNGKSGCDYVTRFLNDAFEIGIGFPNEWLIIIERKSFHKIITWYLYNYIFLEWFGLRRYIWYKLLTVKVNEYKIAKRENI